MFAFNQSFIRKRQNNYVFYRFIQQETSFLNDTAYMIPCNLQNLITTMLSKKITCIIDNQFQSKYTPVIKLSQSQYSILHKNI